MERDHRGGEVDIPAASIQGNKKCLVAWWWRWGTPLPRVRLGIGAGTRLPLSRSVVALSSPSHLLSSRRHF